MMLNYTKCDAVMFARGAKGNPFIFSDTLALLETGKGQPDPTAKERAKEFLHFIEIYSSMKRQKFAELKDHARWFARDSLGFLKKKVEGAKVMEDLLRIFKQVH